MSKEVSLDQLWNSAQPTGRTFTRETLRDIPEAACRYLEHAIAPNTQLASAVRLRMHGEIKLRGWLPFTAEEVIHSRRGFLWAASVRMCGLSIRGSDRMLDGQASMRWKLLGLIPVMTASGRDITRSAAGRLQSECIWLPSMLCGPDVLWSAEDQFHPRARCNVQAEAMDLQLSIDPSGRIETLKLARWGNPEGREYHYACFGAFADEEMTFGGYTLPSRVRAGWHFGTDRFEPEGEFFRATIDDAEYR